MIAKKQSRSLIDPPLHRTMGMTIVDGPSMSQLLGELKKLPAWHRIPCRFEVEVEEPCAIRNAALLDFAG